VPELLVPALADQVQVQLAERGQVPVRVILQLRVAVGVLNLKQVLGNGPGRLPDDHLEHPLMDVRHRVAAAVGQHDGDGRGERAQRPDGDAARSGVRAEHGVRVVVVTGDKPLDLRQGNGLVLR
jgi:hypothetical protein